MAESTRKAHEKAEQYLKDEVAKKDAKVKEETERLNNSRNFQEVRSSLTNCISANNESANAYGKLYDHEVAKSNRWP
jgi:hypothetical protein